MRLPNLDPSGGELSVREVLIEYDGPQLFIAKNAAGSLFIALHGPEIDGRDHWLFVRSTSRRIGQLKRSQITLREAVSKYPVGVVAIAAYPDYEADPTVDFIAPNEVHERFLPHYDSYLGDPNKYAVAEIELVDYGGGNQKAITPWEDFLEPPTLPIPVQAELWEFDRRTISYLKSNMTPLNVVAARRGRMVADIVFSSGEDRTDFPVPELGKILINMQKALDSLAVDETTATPRGRPSATLKRQTRLDAVATFPSSFGLRVEAHEGSLVDGAKSEVAFYRFIDLLSSITDEAALAHAFSQHSTETKLYFGEVIKEVAKVGSSIRVRAGSAYNNDVQTAAVPADAVQKLAEQIAEINSQESRAVNIRGRLKAVSLKTKFFLIENDDESISGRIADDILPQMSGSEINAWYDAKILEQHVLHELTGKVEAKRTLIALEKVAAAT